MNIKSSTVKSDVWAVMSKSDSKNKFGLIHDVIIYSLIVLNTLFIGLISFQSLNQIPAFLSTYKWLTVGSIVVFSIEYILRLWACTSQQQYSSPLGWLKYVFSPLPMIDAVVIGAVVLLGPEANLVFLRLIVVSKVVEYYGAGEFSPLSMLKCAFTSKKDELFITVILSVGLLLLCSYLIFYVERPAMGEETTTIVPSLGWAFSVLTKTAFYEYSPVTTAGKTLHVFMVMLGVIIVGLPIGIITGGFVGEIAEGKKQQTLKINSDLLLKSFSQEQKITLRKLVEKLGLPSERKYLDVDLATARLQLSESEIIQAANFSSSLRLRACRRDAQSAYEDNLVLESFPTNTSYGCFIERRSAVHVISTQNCGDMGIGHFSRLLALSLGASYYSNEFFSSANLLPETQINFAVNELYNEDNNFDPAPFKEWKKCLFENIGQGDTVLYLGTASADHKHALHILCGGEKGIDSIESVAEKTVDDINVPIELFKFLSTQLQPYGLKVAHHDEFGNTNPDHLSRVLRNKKDANVICIYVSQKILQFISLNEYYEIMDIVSHGVELVLPNNRTNV